MSAELWFLVPIIAGYFWLGVGLWKVLTREVAGRDSGGWLIAVCVSPLFIGYFAGYWVAQ